MHIHKQTDTQRDMLGDIPIDGKTDRQTDRYASLTSCI
jgi:hypothetical protein